MMFVAHFSRRRPARLVMGQKLIFASRNRQIFTGAWLFRHIISILAQSGFKSLETYWLVACMQSFCEWSAFLLITLLSIIVIFWKLRLILCIAIIRFSIDVDELSFALVALLVNYGLRKVHLVVVFLIYKQGTFKGKRVLILLFPGSD